MTSGCSNGEDKSCRHLNRLIYLVLADIENSVSVPAIPPYILAQFRNKYQFNPDDRPKLVSSLVVLTWHLCTSHPQPEYTDEQFRDKFGSDAHLAVVRAIEEKRKIAEQYRASTS
jgi:hypothetical protein